MNIKVLETMKNNRLNNYIAAGLSSSLIGGKEYGKVRIFEADRYTRDTVTPHSHRFDFCAHVLCGKVENTIYRLSGAIADNNLDLFCRSKITQVCGKDGILNFNHEREEKPSLWIRDTTTYGSHDNYHMAHDEIHSIVFHKNTKVLFFEGPEITDHGFMLEPWVNGKCVPTFKTEDWMFEKIGDM